jgi:hypothetical protein
VIGRKGQMIKYRGTTLYPPAIFDMLNEAPYISEYIIEVYTGAQDTDEVRLHLHTALPVDECDRQLRGLLQSRLRVVPQLQYHASAEIQAMLMPPGSRKQVRFIDSRTNEMALRRMQGAVHWDLIAGVIGRCPILKYAALSGNVNYWSYASLEWCSHTPRCQETLRVFWQRFSLGRRPCIHIF